MSRAERSTRPDLVVVRIIGISMDWPGESKPGWRGIGPLGLMLFDIDPEDGRKPNDESGNQL